jgi:hypothetical protein
MTQNEHYGNTGAKFPVHRLDIFNLHPLQDFLGRHCGEFNAAEKVSAKSLEMAADEPTHFSQGFLIGKCNSDVALCQVSIFRGQAPRTKTEQLSEGNGNAPAIANPAR